MFSWDHSDSEGQLGSPGRERQEAVFVMGVLASPNEIELKFPTSDEKSWIDSKGKLIHEAALNSAKSTGSKARDEIADIFDQTSRASNYSDENCGSHPHLRLPI